MKFSVTLSHCQGFPKDRKELILQYLSGLASPSQGKDQTVVRNFLSALGSSLGKRDPMFYLNIIQKMKGEWYNQEGEQLDQHLYKAVHSITFRPAEANVIHEMCVRVSAGAPHNIPLPRTEDREYQRSAIEILLLGIIWAPLVCHFRKGT